MTRRIALTGNNSPEDFKPEFFDMGPFQITYNFSHAIRNNAFPLKGALFSKPKAARTGYYGAEGWSFRMLYEFLCEAYNGGEYFVDTYFQRKFGTRRVNDELHEIYETIQDDINAEKAQIYMTLPLRKDGLPDMRYTVSKKYMDFKVWQDPIIKQDCKRVAEDIRHDIQVCLSTGEIPLRGHEGAKIAKKTRELREKLGGMKSADQLFYASGQLIDHLNIFVEIGDVAA
jgi:hypothetical protein